MELIIQRVQIKYLYGLHVSCWPYGISHGGRGLLASHFKKPARIQVCGLSDCQWAFRGLQRVQCDYCLQGQDISSSNWWVGLGRGSDRQIEVKTLVSGSEPLCAHGTGAQYHVFACLKHL